MAKLTTKSILISGGTGFIGRPLCVELCKLGYKLTLISRDPDRMEKSWGLPTRFVKWDMEKEDCPISLDGFDAVISLAGENISGGRWTEERKKRIYDSRIKSTQALGRAMALRSSPLPVFLSTSATGYYDYSQSKEWVESDPPGGHFLAKVCRDWEAAAEEAPNVLRESRLRFGVVLGDDGGAGQKMVDATLWGGGAILGSGDQYISWIHRADIIGIMRTALEDERYAGAINCVAPQPCTQELFQKTLGALLHRPVLLKAPKFALKALLGDMSEIVLESCRVLPERLRELDYPYQYPDLQSALREICSLHPYKGREVPCRRLTTATFIPKPLSDVFAFFSHPSNLERITPPTLNFHVQNLSTNDIREGTRIEYKLRLHGVPMYWETLIKDWQDDKRFVDTQEKGPYSIWHHRHEFFAVPGGTLMTDEVKYRLPMGFVGDAVALPFVRRDVQKIFDFRREAITSIFATPSARS